MGSGDAGGATKVYSNGIEIPEYAMAPGTDPPAEIEGGRMVTDRILLAKEAATTAPTDCPKATVQDVTVEQNVGATLRRYKMIFLLSVSSMLMDAGSTASMLGVSSASKGSSNVTRSLPTETSTFTFPPLVGIASCGTTYWTLNFAQ